MPRIRIAQGLERPDRHPVVPAQPLQHRDPGQALATDRPDTMQFPCFLGTGGHLLHLPAPGRQMRAIPIRQPRRQARIPPLMLMRMPPIRPIAGPQIIQGTGQFKPVVGVLRVFCQPITNPGPDITPTAAECRRRTLGVSKGKIEPQKNTLTCRVRIRKQRAEFILRCQPRRGVAERQGVTATTRDPDAVASGDRHRRGRPIHHDICIKKAHASD